jgi:hypothetical protein
MIWNHADVAFIEGMAAARGWAAEHGHLLAPTDATWQGYPIGQWLKPVSSNVGDRPVYRLRLGCFSKIVAMGCAVQEQWTDEFWSNRSSALG